MPSFLRFLCLAFLTVALASPQQDELALKSRHAKELMAAGRFAEAVPIYVELVRAVPGNPGLLLNLGLAQQMAGQRREAIRSFEAAVKFQPDLFPAWISMGSAYMDLGEPAKAIAPLEKTIALQPGNLLAREILAQALFATGRFEPAAREYRKLAEMDPRNPKVWHGLGRSYEALSQRAFERLEKTGQGSAWWLALVAETRLSQKQYGSAFALYREALAKMPKMRGVNAALAEIYRNTGHADWAAAAEKKDREIPAPDCAVAKQECAFHSGRMLEAARASQSATPESYYWQARAYNVLATQAFARLGQLPASVEIYRLKSQIASGRRSYVEAASELREALKLAPGDSQLRLELAIALHRSRDHKGAEAVLAELLKADPESALVNLIYGDVLLTEGQVEKSIPYLEKAYRKNPNELQAHASLGLAYARAGHVQKAMPHLKAGLELDVDGSLHYQLARAYQAAGQAELAKQALEKYQQLLQQAQAEQAQITPP